MFQKSTRGQEGSPIGHKYCVVKRPLEPASPRVATTELVDLGIAALQRQRLGYRQGQQLCQGLRRLECGLQRAQLGHKQAFVTPERFCKPTNLQIEGRNE